MDKFELTKKLAECDALAARLAEVERERDAQKAKTDEWRNYCHETHDLLMASDEALAALEAIRRQERAAGKAEGMREVRELTRDWIPAVAWDAILARAEAIEGVTE